MRRAPPHQGHVAPMENAAPQLNVVFGDVQTGDRFSTVFGRGAFQELDAIGKAHQVERGAGPLRKVAPDVVGLKRAGRLVIDLEEEGALILIQSAAGLQQLKDARVRAMQRGQDESQLLAALRPQFFVQIEQRADGGIAQPAKRFHQLVGNLQWDRGGRIPPETGALPHRAGSGTGRRAPARGDRHLPGPGGRTSPGRGPPLRSGPG